MNYVLTTAIGVFVGYLMALNQYQPTNLKTQISEKATALESCQTQLAEANQKIVGMLMNK